MPKQPYKTTVSFHAQVVMKFTRQIVFEAHPDTDDPDLEQMAIDHAKRLFCGEFEEVEVVELDYA